MLSLVGFILYKTEFRCGKSTPDSDVISASRSMNEFQMLVCIVAVVFSFSWIPWIIINIIVVNGDFRGLDTNSPKSGQPLILTKNQIALLHTNCVFTLLNSTVNFVIYYVVYARFRRACKRFWNDRVCRMAE